MAMVIAGQFLGALGMLLWLGPRARVRLELIPLYSERSLPGWSSRAR